MGQNANLTEFLDYFETFVILIVEDQLNLFEKDLLILTSEAVIKHFAVSFNS